MGPILYHYVHCPYCIRVRLACGLLGVSYESRVLPYDDEITPVKLTGKKMLPIIEYNGAVINESLDIISLIDENDILGVKSFTASEEFRILDDFLNQLAGPIHSMAMPYWIYTPEFSSESRSYFQKKKEIKRGPFKELVHRRIHFEEELRPLLKKIEEKISPFYESKAIGIKDLLLASHMWGLYVVPEFQFSEKVHFYLQQVKRACRFDYHKDFWS
jgi:glutaredoxin 2